MRTTRSEYDITPVECRRAGMIYVARIRPTIYKIGMTGGNVKFRLGAIKQYFRDLRVPFDEITLIHTILTDDCCRAECRFHDRYAAKRLPGFGELFQLTNSELAEIQAIAQLIYY